MFRLAVFAGTLTAMLATAGCTERFRDTFESDAAGAAPAAAPAGPPDDKLSFDEGIGKVTVTAAGPLDGSRTLRIGGPGGAAASAPFVLMNSEPLANPAHRVEARWRGRISAGATARVLWFAGPVKPIAEIVLEAGQIRLAGDVVGSYDPGTTHTIWMSANPATDRVRVSARGGINPVVWISVPVSNAGGFPDTPISLAFSLLAGGADDAYLVDEVRMREHNQ